MQKEVELHGRRFGLDLPAERIRKRISAIAGELARNVSDTPVVLGVLRGAAIFHSDLIRACPFELEVGYLRTRSYVGMESSGHVELDVPDDPELADRTLVVVEDIVDSGRTLTALLDELRRRGAKRILTVVLLDKPAARQVEFRADIVGFRVPNDFLVGYGLDYDGLGRNLPSIYRLLS